MTALALARSTLAIPFALGVACTNALSASAQGLDRPIREVWQARRAWDASAEAEYSAFVTAIGRAVAKGRCHSLNVCLNNPTINPLHEAGARPLHFRADCADVPYILRGYFAYRRGLPFAFAARMRGAGSDQRYMAHAHPEGLRVWTEYPTPRALFESIGDIVHSGYFRTAPEVEPSDAYPAAIRPGAIRPGTIYYDPNGHVLVVYDVRPGRILMFDGHPGGSLTHYGPYDDRLPVGRPELGGGFKNFRPVVYRHGRAAQPRNAELEDFGMLAQRASMRSAGRFHAWVLERMSARPGRRRAQATPPGRSALH